MPASVRLSLRSESRPEVLMQTTSDLAADLSRQPGMQAEEATSPGRPGTRSGAEQFLGQLVLTLVGTAGIGTALVRCLQAYIERDRSLSFTIKRADGAELSLEARHLKGPETEATFRTVRDFIGESAWEDAGWPNELQS